MNEPRAINSKLKAGLTYGPLLCLPLFYRIFRDQSVTVAGQTYQGFIIAAVLFAVVLIVSIVVLWRLTGKISPMNIVTLGVVLFLAGMTLWFNDARFIKMKPTIVYAFFAAVLGVGLLQGKSYLKYVMEEAFPMQPEGWMILTRRFTLFFLGMAVLNEVIWRNFSDATWIWFKVGGITVAMVLFGLTQVRVLERYGIEEKAE